ncbi:MAG: hypothetical protein IJZ79_02965 [Bacilli bacterium]|nr:hypothetical protein [Bacilli bacterium]MBQ8218687.1 hypothetical protein [Bacilli bacterium]
MMTCPKCSGYGQTTSTRNGKNEVIRYHKCRECGNTFVSVQKLENNYISFSRDTINDIIKSDKFKFAISKLFDAFELHGNNNFIDFSNDFYDSNEFELVSNIFLDHNNSKNYKFIIHLRTYQNTASGIIKLCEINENETEIAALVGFITYDTEWSVQLNIDTINKFITQKLKTLEEINQDLF